MNGNTAEFDHVISLLFLSIAVAQLNKNIFPRVAKRSYSFKIIFLILESCPSAEVVAAVDVNTLANEVYKHNFPSTPLWAKTIEVSNDCLFLL